MRSQYLLLLVIITGAFLVRLVGADQYYFHTDELVHFFIANRGTLIETLMDGFRETQPPFGHVIRYVINHFSDSMIVSRLASIIFGLGSIVVAYLIGDKISKNSFYAPVLAIFVAFTKISVVYTTSARNYAFFLFFIMLGYYLFLLYAQSRKHKYLLLYLLMFLMACATHFSGYIFAAAIGIAMVIQLFYEKKYKDILYQCLGHVPHAIFLITMYYIYFIHSDAGNSLQNMYNSEGMRILHNTDIGVGIMSVFAGFFYFSFQSFAIGFPLFLYGTYSLLRTNKIVGQSIIIALVIQVFLLIFKLYPFVGSRYCLYLLPFFILALGKAVSDIISFLPRRNSVVIIGIVMVSVVTYQAIKENFYFKEHGEFTVTNASFKSGISFIENNISKDDIVLTNKGSWLHLLYKENKDGRGYYPDSLGHINYNGLNLFFLEKSSYWELTSKQHFDEFIDLVKPKITKASRVFFLVFGTSDYSIFTLFNCRDLQSHINNIFIDRGVLIYRLDRDFVVKQLLTDNNTITQCFDESKEAHFGGWFDKNSFTRSFP